MEGRNGEPLIPRLDCILAITKWADELRKEITWINYAAFKMDKIREKARRHYWNHKDERMITVPCDHCKQKYGIESHEIGIKAYNENLEKNNGRYICIHENGFIQGSKPKDHMCVDNPFAAEGKKQCNNCNQVKPYAYFSPKKGGDGYMARCKECRAKISKDRYQQKKGGLYHAVSHERLVNHRN